MNCFCNVHCATTNQSACGLIILNQTGFPKTINTSEIILMIMVFVKKMHLLCNKFSKKLIVVFPDYNHCQIPLTHWLILINVIQNKKFVKNSQRLDHGLTSAQSFQFVDFAKKQS